MRNVLACFLAFFLILSIASLAMAGGVVNKTNWSAEYIRTMNRNAATDFADAVFYNPAGTVHMEPGGYFNISAHYFPKLYEHDITSSPFEGADGNYENDEPSIVPGVFTMYNAGQYSLFFGVSNMIGGGKVEYEDGSLTMVGIGALMMKQANLGPNGLAAAGFPQDAFYNTIESQQIEADQYAPGYMVGGALKLNDQLSLSMGFRYIDAQKEAKGSVTIGAGGTQFPGVNDDRTANIDYEQDAQGVGAIVGMNYTPTRDTTFAARYESRTAMRYNYTVNDGEDILLSQGITTGMTLREDHPATLGLGVSHQVLPKLRAETNLTYYFNKDADWEGKEKKFNNGFDAGLALEYNLTPDMLASIGYMYTKNGLKSRHADEFLSTNPPENPNLDSHTVGFGGAYHYRPNLAFNLGLGGVFYDDDDITTDVGDVEYEKTIYFFALGVQYKFL